MGVGIPVNILEIMKNTLFMKGWLYSLLSLLFPRYCVACGKPLVKGEDCLCAMCNINLPRTDYHLEKDNCVEQIFWGKIPLEHATSFLFYRKGSDYRQILHRLKYGGEKEIGAVIGRYMAAEIQPSGFFEGIDVIIPVPLHKKKLRSRGYNQSEWIAKGVSVVTGIPIDATSVKREKNTETQTRKTVLERWENVEGTFRLQHPEKFSGKHILLIDDVLTTGATIVACAASFEKAEDVRISILTLTMAQN